MFQYLGCTSSTSYWSSYLASNYGVITITKLEPAEMRDLPPSFIACRHQGDEEFVEDNTASYGISLGWRLLDISQPDTWCENTTNDITVGNCLLLKLIDHQMNDFNKISNHWVDNYSSCFCSPERTNITPSRQSTTQSATTELNQQIYWFKQN